MRLFPVILLALCCCACGPEIAPESTATKETTATETDELKPGILDGFPTEVIESGCDCSLRLENNQDKDLFFVFDWQGDGGGKLRINGKDVLVQRGASLKTGDEKYDSYLHQNANWTVKTSITEKGPAGDEGTAYTGKVRISNRRTGDKLEVRVKGTCSC